MDSITESIYTNLPTFSLILPDLPQIVSLFVVVLFLLQFSVRVLYLRRPGSGPFSWAVALSLGQRPFLGSSGPSHDVHHVSNVTQAFYNGSHVALHVALRMAFVVFSRHRERYQSTGEHVPERSGAHSGHSVGDSVGDKIGDNTVGQEKPSPIQENQVPTSHTQLKSNPETQVQAKYPHRS